MSSLEAARLRSTAKKVLTASMSSYSKALKIAEILKAEIERGDFLLSKPYSQLPVEQGMKPLNIREREDRR